MSDWEDPTGIETIQNSRFKIQNDVYDLSGRKVMSGKKSSLIIIEKGKKKVNGK
jgi:hypothetical protein